jgi:thioredoxin reductase
MTSIPFDDIDLIVVGCGPTGVAALVQAALEGIPAIGIEEGPAPLASLLSYMDGLVFTSPAFHYEVGGLPLDCRAVDHVTREDVLHYYARVITHFGLNIRCNTKCTGLRPRDGSVEVSVQTAAGPGVYRAKRALVASWFERRTLPPDSFAPAHKIAVSSTLQNPIQLAGRNVVILGGGMSAHEYASRLMLNGQKIVLLSRNGPSPRDKNPRFGGLLAATGSSVWHHITDFVTGPSSVAFTHNGLRQTLACDALVVAIGQRLREDILQMLSAACVLSEHETFRLRSARSWEKLKREFPREDEASLMKLASAELPDLRQHVFEGKHGIHLAGGALHVGSSNAGVMYSMYTAILAVKAMTGHPPPHGAEAPLPMYFAALNLPEELPPALAYERISSLRPLPALGRTRSSIPPGVEEGGRGQTVRRGTARSRHGVQFLDGDPEAMRILRAVDGTSPVSELASRFGMHSVAERTIFWKLLRYLWWNDALTWLPPAGTPRKTLAAL